MFCLFQCRLLLSKITVIMPRLLTRHARLQNEQKKKENNCSLLSPESAVPREGLLGTSH